MPLKRAFPAALLLCAVPATAPAQDSPYPAIATGLAIPIEQDARRDAEIPARGRSVIVDTASARLFMVEDGRVVDSMRVIVGKPEAATPTIKSTLYYATLNPYWNVPVEMARTLIARNVLKQGPSYLREKGYEIVSGFMENPRILSPDSVDWQAVAAGREKVFVRQRPGPANSMGQMKFAFANDDGIFLHDTPRKELFDEAQRMLSAGCVRLEDAPRFARWLLGRDPAMDSAEPERHVALPRPVPILIAALDSTTQMQLAAWE